MLIISCGKGKQTNDKKPREEINEDGIFYGDIGSFNKNATSGFIKINKIGDSVEVTVNVKGSSSKTEQYLYAGDYCPSFATEVATTCGKRLMAFDVGTHETSYSVMLADLRMRSIRFEDKTFIVYQGNQAVGCANIDRYFEEPPFPEPEPEAPRRRPPTHRPQKPELPEVKPPPPQEHDSWWDRLSDRLRRWWCRVRRRCG